MAVLLNKLELVAIKTENVQNVTQSFAATDYMYVQDVAWKLNTEKLPRDYSRATLDTLPSLIGQVSLDISFKTEFKGSGTSGSYYLPLDACLQASGLVPSASTREITYLPSDTQLVISSSSFVTPYGKSATISINKAGYQIIGTGMLASPKMIIENKIPLLEFSFKGLFTQTTDTVLPTASISAQLPAKVQNCQLSMDGYTPIASKLEIDFGTAINQVNDISSNNGIYGFSLGTRKPKGSFDPLAIPKSSYDFVAKMLAGTNVTSSFVLGTVPGNRITVTCPYTQYEDVSVAAKGDNMAFQIPVTYNGTNANWISIVFS
jgi:hypothetical protein